MDFTDESYVFEEQHNYYSNDNNLSQISYARRVLASCTKVGMQDLILLGTIQPGDTICVSTLSVVVHRSWSTWIWRTALRESRDKTKAWVELVVDFAINEIVKFTKMNATEYLSKQVKFIEEVTKATKGIENLTKTYKDDADTVKFFNQCSEMLTGYALGIPIKIANIDPPKESCPVEIPSQLSDFIVVDIEDQSVPNVPSEITITSSPSERLFRWMSSTTLF